MKFFTVVFISKVLWLIGRMVGRGSNLPGKVALRLYPDILARLKLPEIIIAVTGSNGKTSVSEMIAHILRSGGMSVGHNREGSNQTEGIATLLLRLATLGGLVKCDALVLECDERYAVKIFNYVKPTALLVTNLCRDQLTRNGHHEFIADCLSDAVAVAGDNATLVLNADDPYVSNLIGQDSDKVARNVVYFGVGKEAVPLRARAGMYDDGAFCPGCKERMDYKYRTAGHFGNFKCSSCTYFHQEPDFTVSNFDYERGEAIINGSISMWVTQRSLTALYNVIAAIAASSTAEIMPQTAAGRLNKFELTGGRFMAMTISRRNVKLLICKHENSMAYNLAFSSIIKQHRPSSVIIFVNAISRKYYTSDTSWLWDIDFDILADKKVKEVILAGKYSKDLEVRLTMSRVDAKKCFTLENISQLREHIGQCSADNIYITTCFADKAKLLDALGVN